MAVLLGAELNAETEREAAAQAGHPQAQASAEELNATECGPGGHRANGANGLVCAKQRYRSGKWF